MPSFDIVSEVDLQEVDNAVNTARKTIDTRYDFRGSNTEIVLDKKEKSVRIQTEDDMKLRAVKDTLAGCLIKRGISPKAVDYGETEAASQGAVRCTAKLRTGIDKDAARDLVKRIKELKLKVQAAIQDEQVRVTGDKIDDLQAVIGALRAADLELPLQFTNMKR